MKEWNSHERVLNEGREEGKGGGGGGGGGWRSLRHVSVCEVEGEKGAEIWVKCVSMRREGEQREREERGREERERERERKEGSETGRCV